MKSNTTSLAVKARLANIVRKSLYNNTTGAKRLTSEQHLKTFTAENKVQFFDMIFRENDVTHRELNNYKRKRKAKALVQKLRVERGYVPKKKTSKVAWDSRNSEQKEELSFIKSLGKR